MVNLSLTRRQAVTLSSAAALLFGCQAYAMHIMEGFLPQGWALAWFAVTLPFFILGLRRLQQIMREQPEKKLLLALAGAFVFLLSALKQQPNFSWPQKRRFNPAQWFIQQKFQHRTGQ